MSLNRVILVGRLGADPETRYTDSGKAVTNFSVATDSTFGENKRTEWTRVVCWEKLAENVSEYLSKGSMVAVEGRLQTRSYDSDGEKKYVTEVVASNVQFLDTRSSEKEEATPTPKQTVKTAPPIQRKPITKKYVASDEDVPF